MSFSDSENDSSDTREQPLFSSSSESTSASASISLLFKEPPGFYEAEKPATFSQHTLLSGQTLNLRLVGHNPLWVGTVQSTMYICVVFFYILHAIVVSRLIFLGCGILQFPF